MTLDSHIEEFESLSDLEVGDYDVLEELAEAEEHGARSPGDEPTTESPAPAASTQARKETDFQRYLAGQSVMKSGLTRDQAEVNRIIAEASKNSKFFLREKAKDEQLNNRIETLMRKVCRSFVTCHLAERLIEGGIAQARKSRKTGKRGKRYGTFSRVIGNVSLSCL